MLLQQLTKFENKVSFAQILVQQYYAGKYTTAENVRNIAILTTKTEFTKMQKAVMRKNAERIALQIRIYFAQVEEFNMLRHC